MTRSTRATASVLPLALLLLAAPAARSDPAPPPTTFEGTTEVLEVQVPVHVMDRSGEPVRGLSAADFRVLEEGEEREITGFEVIDLELLNATDPVERALQDKALPAAARRHFLLLFDLTFSDPAAVIKARAAARRFVLDHLHPTDLAAVMTLSMDFGPRLVVTFTPDRAQLARGIDTLGLTRLDSAQRIDPLRFVIEDIDGELASTDNVSGAGRGSDSGLLDGIADGALARHLTVIDKQMQRMEKSFQRGRVSSWAGTLRDVAKSLDSIKGRKFVILFSEGFDGRLMLGRSGDPNDPAAASDQFHLRAGNFWMVDTDDIYGNGVVQTDMARMLEEFRRADAVIQTVDISGLDAGGAEAQRRHQVGQSALFYMADDTGGTLLENANDLVEELPEVLRPSSVTYLLTFRADGVERDGSYRELEVKADLPRGTRLVHREGYYAPRPFPELHPLEKSLLASGAIAAAEPKREIGVAVLAAPFRANESLAYVPIILEIDGPDLLAAHQGEQLTTEVYAYVTDERGRMRDFFTQLLTVDLASSGQMIRASGLKYYGALELDPGSYLVRVLVRNNETGRTGVESLPLTVPEFAQAEPVLLPPFFLEQPGSWLLVREQAAGDRVVYPFTINGDPYIPAAHPKLSPDAESELCLVAYNLGPGAVELSGEVKTADGRTLPARALALVERTVTGIEGVDKLLVTFQPEADLEAGDYRLEVGVVDPGTGARRVSSIPFSIPQ